jgi:hypothetical protein
MAAVYPEVAPLQELRRLLSQLRQVELPIGPDGRARCLSGTFGSITGRNQPAAADFIFSWPSWCRGLVRPAPGRALAYLDYQQQEYLIAAVLSRDEAMLADYLAGDCYLGLGKSLGLIPADGTKETHGPERNLCKVITLATLYGQAAPGLARRTGRTRTVAADWLRRHRERYRRFWRWSDAMVDFARCYRQLWTRLGWRVHVARGSRDTTWRNWPVQATGGDVLRVAVCLLTEAGITVNAMVHDSVLIEADGDRIDAVADRAEHLMQLASEKVLGQALRTDRQVVRYPGRLLDKKGTATWERIWRLVADGGAGASLPSDPAPPLARVGG